MGPGFGEIIIGLVLVTLDNELLSFGCKLNYCFISRYRSFILLLKAF